MNERATVKRICEDRVFVSCDTSSCQGCKASMFCRNRGRTFEVSNPDRISLSTGDMVDIELPPARTIASTFITLMVPLFLFFLFMLIPQSSEAMKALSGFIGLAAGFILAGIYFRITRKKYMAYITGVCDEK